MTDPRRNSGVLGMGLEAQAALLRLIDSQVRMGFLTATGVVAAAATIVQPLADVDPPTHLTAPAGELLTMLLAASRKPGKPSMSQSTAEMVQLANVELAINDLRRDNDGVD